MNIEPNDNANTATQAVLQPSFDDENYDTLNESGDELTEAQKNALDYEEGDIVQIEEEFYPNDDTEEEDGEITPGDIQAE